MTISLAPHGHLSTPNYRADIDGLRAVAVLLVIAFHAFPTSVPGGFIGVDIFFVISGFLISFIIFSSLEQGRFGFLEFYSRRIRRIFPALIVVLATCFALGWFTFFTGEFKQLGKHIAGGAGFVSNIVLLTETGYFDDSSLNRPLLNLWSLAVEEQFYIVWPLLVWMIWKLRIPILPVLAITLVASFLWSALPILFKYQSTLYVPQLPLRETLLRLDFLAAFFLPQGRFWELLIGSALAYGMLYHQSVLAQCHRRCEAWLIANIVSIRSRDRLRDLQSILGGLLIVAGVVFLNKTVLFPGFWALLPTLGALLIISSGSQSWLNRRILSRRLLRGIGLISYPLYLWHWPLLIFAYTIRGDEHTPLVRALCIVVTFILAWLTYQLIEKPLRFGRYPIAKSVALMGMMFFVGYAGYYTYKNGGLDFRNFAQQTKFFEGAMTDWGYPSDLTAPRKNMDGIKIVEGSAEIFGSGDEPPQVVFVGDSHMRQYAPRASLLSKQKNMPVMFVTGGGCQVILQPHNGDSNPYCALVLENLQKVLERNPSVKTIVIAGRWNTLFDSGEHHKYGITTTSGTPKKDKQAIFDSFKDYLQPLSKKYTVYLMLDNPLVDSFNPRHMIQNRLTFKDMTNSLGAVAMPQDQLNLTNEIRALGLASGAKIIDPLASLCPKGECKRFYDGEKPIYFDQDHLTAGYVRNHATYLDKAFSH